MVYGKTTRLRDYNIKENLNHKKINKKIDKHNCIVVIISVTL